MIEKKQHEKAVILLRQKKYFESYCIYKNLINNYEISYTDELQYYRNDCNSILTCLFHIINDTEEENNDIENYYKEYNIYLEKYLLLAKNTNDSELITWADNILLNIFENTMKIIILYYSSVISNTTIQKQKLTAGIKNFYKKFITIFTKDNLFNKKIFLEKYLDVLYYERTNIIRVGNIRQNYLNCIWLGELFLEIVKKDDNTSKIRAAVMILLSDIVLFSPTVKTDKFASELKSIEWLEKSISEYSKYTYAKERVRQLKLYISSVEQINRFRHDAVSKIESIRGVIKKIKTDNNKSINSNLLETAENHINYILSSFRLTQKGKPILKKVDMKDILLKFSDIKINVKGKKRLLETDADYVYLILQNLIKNSLEAYKNKIEKEINLIFDYDTLTLIVEDFAGGISSELLDKEKLFEPYTGTKGIYQNSGLGLANVKNACELLNANIKVNSKINYGTKFIIKFNEFEED